MSSPEIRVVLISAEPEGQAQTQPTRELEAIRTAVEGGQVKFRRESVYHATRESVMSGIEDNLPQVVHWHSHGERDGAFIEGEDGAATRVEATWLVDVIGACRETRLVVLNACESIHLAEALVTSTRTSVRAAIAWTVRVPNTHVRKFSAALYRQLARGKSVVEAYDFARRTLETNLQGAVKLVQRVEGADFLLYEPPPPPPPSPPLPLTVAVPLRLRVLVGMLVAGLLALAAYTLWDELFQPSQLLADEVTKQGKDTSDEKSLPPCRDGFVRVAGTCECPEPRTRVGDRCVTPAAPSRCPGGMKLIPGGTFKTWTVADLCVDVTEVTVEAFGVAATDKHTSNSDGQGDEYCNTRHKDRSDHPMNCVDWNDARDYCHSRGKRLPTAAEWEWAARGRDEGRKYPWGDQPPTCMLAVINNGGDGCGKRQTATVGSRSPAGDTRDGLTDMVGNVFEWTDTRVDERRVLRGGSWATANPDWLTTAYTTGYDPSTRSHVFGIRCVKPPRTP